jgi:hypothetical protein
VSRYENHSSHRDRGNEFVDDDDEGYYYQNKYKQNGPQQVTDLKSFKQAERDYAGNIDKFFQRPIDFYELHRTLFEVI